MLVVFGALLPQPSAPEADEHWVAYLVTWHVTARGSGHHATYTEDLKLKRFSETMGSAIVRFGQARDGNLSYHDGRYLFVQVSDKQETWRALSSGCNTYESTEITDPTENSGLNRTAGSGGELGDLFPQQSYKRPDGFLEFRYPALELGFMVTTHWALVGISGRGCTGTLSEVTTPRHGWAPPPPETPEQLQKFVLQSVRPNDNSYFSMNVRFSLHGTSINNVIYVEDQNTQYTEQVEWTAEARRLGKCPCALNSN